MNLGKEEELVISVFKNIVIEGNIHKLEKCFFDIDYKYFYKLLCTQKVFLSYYKHIITFVPHEFLCLYNDEYNNKIKKINIYVQHLKEVIELAKINGYDILIEKGFPLAKYIYSNIYERNIGDIDIMLREKDTLSFANLLINELAYKCHSMDLIGIGTEKSFSLATPITEFQLHKDFPEIALEKKLENEVKISLDVKRGSSAILIKYMPEFLENIETIKINGLEINTYNLHYTFTHLLANAYSNTRPIFAFNPTNLRDYLDICLFIKKYIGMIDWNEICDISSRMNLHKKIQVVINNINQIIPDFIDKKTFDLFDTKNDVISFYNDIKYRIPFLNMLFDYNKYQKEFGYAIKQKYYYKKNYFTSIETSNLKKNNLYNMYCNSPLALYYFEKECDSVIFSTEFVKYEISPQNDYRIVLMILDDNTNCRNIENVLSLFNTNIFQFNLEKSIKECVLNNKPIQYTFDINNKLETIDYKVKLPIDTVLTNFKRHQKIVYKLFISKRFEDNQFRIIAKKFDLLAYDGTLGIVNFD
jgi:hypothetical protein